MDELKGLATDKWYRALTYIGAVVLIAVVAIPNDAELRKTLILLALGTILVGIGQWIDHGYQTKVGPGFLVHGYPYEASITGTLLLLGGLGLIGRALWLLW